MSRIVYVNGQYLPEEEATVSIFDRGFLMADGVYEVTSVLEVPALNNPWPGSLQVAVKGWFDVVAMLTLWPT